MPDPRSNCVDTGEDNSIGVRKFSDTDRLPVGSLLNLIDIRSQIPVHRPRLRCLSDKLQVLTAGLSLRNCLVSGGIVVKRAVDIAASAALLLITMPVLALAAGMILITSPGPVLFLQTRMGRGFRPFQIIKLRTMVHAEAGLAYTLGPDPRITRVGKWLRRTKVDELPQLWNVLRGEMSLVGPRPVVPELTTEFREFYVYLLRARPGLTDPASLKYSQETRLIAMAEDPMHFFKTVVTPDKIQISLEYLERANLWTDSVTLAMTAVICCFPSMSRIYGELPELGTRNERSSWETIGSTVDQSIFTHDLAYQDLAYLEAAVEDRVEQEAVPWIPLPNQNFRSGSAPVTAKESA